MRITLSLVLIQLLTITVSYSQSAIYGINSKGGNGSGHIFKYSTADDRYEEVYNFQNNLTEIGREDEFFVHPNGKLYAFVKLPCSIGISSYSPLTNEYKVLNQTAGYGNFVFGKPAIGSNGLLYGVGGHESEQLVVLSYNIQTNVLDTAAFFEPAHGIPVSNLILASNGKFYLLTGSALCCFDPNKSADHALSVLEYGAFPSNDLVEAQNGILYGNTNNRIFSYDYIQNTFSVKSVIPGVNPNGLTKSPSDGMLYGLCRGGNSAPGKLYQYNVQTDQVTELHTFGTNTTDLPCGRLTPVGSKLYGTTFYGTQGLGNIFSYDINTSNFVALAEFTDSYAQGYGPIGTLAYSGNGKLYGMAKSAGAYYGVIFEFDPGTSAITLRIRFDSNQNNLPAYKPLVLASDGLLYSWFVESPSFLFSFDPASNTYQKRAGLPLDKIFYNLVDAGNGKLYLSALDNSVPNDGSILEYHVQNDSLAVVYFNSGYPKMTSMIAGNDGELYGYCQTSNFEGLAFCKFSPETHSITLIKQFSGSFIPGTLRKDAEGKIVGIPVNKYGTGATFLFSYNPENLDFNYLHSFPPNETTNYHSSFCVGKDQKVYGFRRDAQNRIFLFSYDLVNNIYKSTIEPDFGWNGYPFSELIMGSDNMLYTTIGLYQSYKIKGSIFRFDPATEQSEILHHTGLACDGSGFGLVEVRSNEKISEDCIKGHCWDLFPNPGSETITLNLPGDLPNSLQIYNAMGQLLMEIDQLESHQKLSIRELKSGMYVVRMNFSDVSITTSLVKH